MNAWTLDPEVALQVPPPIAPWPAWPRRWVRISAQLYNHPDEYERLAAALVRRLRTP